MKLGALIHENRGFTLVELMVTLAVAAILATMAAPMLSRFLARSQMNAVANELGGAFQQARMEAVNRNTCVSVCRRATNGAATCAAVDGPWSSGWLVYANPNCSAASLATDPPAGTEIRVHDAVPTSITLNRDLGGNAPDVVVFTPRGVLLSLSMANRMALSDTRYEDGSNSRILVLDRVARVRWE